MGAEALAEAGIAEWEGAGDGGGKEGGPGHEPDEDETEKESERDGVVVAGDAQVEVAEELLVHEVEPGPAVNVAVGGERDLPMAVEEGKRAGVALSWIAKAGEDVPGGGEEEEDCRAWEGVKLADAGSCGTGKDRAEASGEKEIQGDDGEGEDDADEALGEEVESAGAGEEVGEPTMRLRLGLPLMEGEQGDGEEDADEKVRDVDAREDKDAEGG